jgi:hypothetical protein
VAAIGDVRRVAGFVGIGEVLQSLRGESLVRNVCSNAEGVVRANFVSQGGRDKELLKVNASAGISKQEDRLGVGSVEPAVAIQRHACREIGP